MADTKKTVVRFEASEFDKMKYILWYLQDGRSQNTYITEAVNDKIAAFEKKHGAITDEKLKEARII